MTQLDKMKALLKNAEIRCRYHSPKNTKYYINKGIKCELNLRQMIYLWKKYNAKNMIKPSLDRKENDKNYTVKNCQIIEWEKNRYEGYARYQINKGLGLI